MKIRGTQYAEMEVSESDIIKEAIYLIERKHNLLNYRIDYNTEAGTLMHYSESHHNGDISWDAAGTPSAQQRTGYELILNLCVTFQVTRKFHG